MKTRLYLIKSTLVGSLGGLLFGFNTAVIAGVTLALANQYSLGTRALDLTVAMALIGAIFGSIGSSSFGRRVGNRRALRFMAVLFLLSAIGCAAAWDWPALLVFRFIGGIAIGGTSVLATVYIAEMAPMKMRAWMVGIFQISIALGLLLAYLSNYAIALVDQGADAWRWQLGMTAVPAVVFLALFGADRRRNWLVTQHRMDEAREALVMAGSPDSYAELREITESIYTERAGRAQPLFTRAYLKPILLAVLLVALNQLSGISAVMYYVCDLSRDAGWDNLASIFHAVVLGAMALLGALLGLALIDRYGRRTLLLTGSIGMALCLFGIAHGYHVAWHGQRYPWDLMHLLMGFVFLFTASHWAVVWTYISEIFPNRVRAKGQSLGSAVNWTVAALIALSFKSAMAVSGHRTFAFFTAAMLLQFLLVLFFFPETRDVPLEELHKKLGIE